MTKVLIDGLFQLKTPLHISDPNSARWDPEEKSFVYGGRGFPCTLTRTQSFFTPAHATERNEGFFSLPVLPAQGLRGRLRRCAAAELEDYVTTQLDEKLHLETYLALHTGAITGNPSGESPAMAEVRKTRQHPFVGLFGGGPNLVPGNLRVAAGVPCVDALVHDLGMIPEDVCDFEPLSIKNGWRLMQVVPLVRNDDLLQGRDTRAKDVIEDYNEQLLGLLDQQMDRKKKKSEGEKSTMGLQALNFYQVVIPGTAFYCRFEVNGTKAQAGLLLHALKRLVIDENGLGGKGALGLGQFGHSLRIHIDGQTYDLFSTQEDLNLDEEAIRGLIEEYEEALEGVNAQSLHEAFVPAK